MHAREDEPGIKSRLDSALGGTQSPSAEGLLSGVPQVRNPIKAGSSVARLQRAATVLVFTASFLAWTPPQRIDRKPSNYVCLAPRLAIGPSGVEHAVWTESPEENRYFDKVVYSRHEGDTWTLPVNVSIDSGYLRSPAILIDGNGRPMVVWSEEGSTRLHYVRQQDDTWTLPRLCFSARGIAPALALDGFAQIHLLFEEFTGRGGIWHSRYVAGCDSWTLPLSVDSSTEPLGRTDVATDLGGRLHAVWQSWGTYGLRYARFDGDTWTMPVSLPDPDSARQSVRPRLFSGVDGAPHVVWEERSLGYWIYHSTLCGDTWIRPLQLSAERGFRPDIFVDRVDRDHVVWEHDSGVAYTCCENGIWSEPFLVVPDGNTYNPVIDGKEGLLRMIWGQDNCMWYREHELAGLAEGTTCAQGSISASLLSGNNCLVVNLAAESEVNLRLLDSLGRELARRSLGILKRGRHLVELPLSGLAAGTYFCELSTDEGVKLHRVVYLRP